VKSIPYTHKQCFLFEDETINEVNFIKLLGFIISRRWLRIYFIFHYPLEVFFFHLFVKVDVLLVLLVWFHDVINYEVLRQYSMLFILYKVSTSFSFADVRDEFFDIVVSANELNIVFISYCLKHFSLDIVNRLFFLLFLNLFMKFIALLMGF